MCRNPQRDGRLPPRTPLNFQSQITGNLAVYGFAFSPFSSTPSPLVSGCIPSLTFAGAHAYSFLIDFQGRRNCDFSTTPGANSCLDGGCNGGLQCDPHTGTGVPPATVAEWTLQGDGNKDFYDVSVVDGFNIPMSITPSAKCSVASCPKDLNPSCPSQLIGPRDSSGNPVGCKSACDAKLDNPSDSANCCTGSHGTSATCPSSGVQSYSYFKSNCPNSYVYAYDESSGTALWTCDSGLKSDYKLTFCP
jgi:hypothetical protein